MKNGNRGHSNEEGDQQAVGNMVTCLIYRPHKQNVSLLTPNNSNHSAANDPETANDPRPEMIPKLDRK